jgi:hypothetical protein
MSPLRQRLLAVGILIGAAALCWLLIVQPVIDAFAAQADDIAQSQLTLAAYQRKIAMRPAVEADLTEMTRREAQLNDAVDGTSAELAAANVQNLIRTMVNADQAQVLSVQNMPPVTANGFERVDIQYELTVPMTRLKDVIYRIETNVPFLFLESVDIHAPENWFGVDPKADVPNLQVRWIVRGYRRLGAP